SLQIKALFVHNNEEISRLKFEMAARLSNPNTGPFTDAQKFSAYIAAQLHNAVITEPLGDQLVHQLMDIAGSSHEILSELASHRNLTHADYDPANILVCKDGEEWKISGILDWEFALSSTYYMDIGLMLRYAHRLPKCFQDSFVRGIQEGNPQLLSSDWEVRAKLIDLVCLLSLCAANPPDKRPQMYGDIKNLLQRTCEFLGRQ
ncbi:MAG: phosphotransferase, partial [Pseudomonadota bacterium]